MLIFAVVIYHIMKLKWNALNIMVYKIYWCVTYNHPTLTNLNLNPSNSALFCGFNALQGTLQENVVLFYSKLQS